jgi:hypothetical protein
MVKLLQPLGRQKHQINDRLELGFKLRNFEVCPTFFYNTTLISEVKYSVEIRTGRMPEETDIYVYNIFNNSRNGRFERF